MGLTIKDFFKLNLILQKKSLNTHNNIIFIIQVQRLLKHLKTKLIKMRLIKCRNNCYEIVLGIFLRIFNIRVLKKLLIAQYNMMLMLLRLYNLLLQTSLLQRNQYQLLWIIVRLFSCRNIQSINYKDYSSINKKKLFSQISKIIQLNEKLRRLFRKSFTAR